MDAGASHTGLWRHSPMPIIAKCFHERCRLAMVVAWGVITVLIVAALSMGTYLAETERFDVSSVEAARAIIFPVIILQAAILMFFGTGAVAYGIANERDSGVLDYQRMTPMSIPAKLIGYLIGLPIREYILFTLTLPFLIFAVVRGGFSWTVVAHFYLIFFMSVIVYHFTGLVSGMVTPKARRAAVFAQIFVVILYFGLTNLSHLGLTFFEFLTIRPALFGLVVEEVQRLNGEVIRFPRGMTGLDSFRDIPLFNTTLHPTVYTMIVQGGLVLSMWHVVARKWRSEEAPAFSKLGAAAFILGTSTLALGSGWASLAIDGGIMRNLPQFADEYDARLGLVLTLVYTGMILAMGMFTLSNASASPFITSKGFHRMRKHGWKSLGLLRDESSSLPLAMLVAACTSISAALLYNRLIAAGMVEGWPSAASAGMLLIALASMALFAQAVFERYMLRGRCVVIFLVWVVPAMTFMVLAAGDARPAIAAYAALPCPPATAVFALDQMTASIPMPPGVEPVWLVREETELAGLFPALAITGVAIHLSLAVIAQTVNLRDRSRRRRMAMAAA